jgi:hypothetical protein
MLDVQRSMFDVQFYLDSGHLKFHTRGSRFRVGASRSALRPHMQGLRFMAAASRAGDGLHNQLYHKHQADLQKLLCLDICHDIHYYTCSDAKREVNHDCIKS